MFPGGSDRREFWQRAEDRNRHTACVYDQLGLPEFYALEGFVQGHPGEPEPSLPALRR
jgi:glucosamine-6-phosphate deaminase